MAESHILACQHFETRNDPNKPHRKLEDNWTEADDVAKDAHLGDADVAFDWFRRVATRYDKLGATFFAFVQLASVRIWLRSIESTA